MPEDNHNALQAVFALFIIQVGLCMIFYCAWQEGLITAQSLARYCVFSALLCLLGLFAIKKTESEN